MHNLNNILLSKMFSYITMGIFLCIKKKMDSIDTKGQRDASLPPAASTITDYKIG